MDKEQYVKYIIIKLRVNVQREHKVILESVVSVAIVNIMKIALTMRLATVLIEFADLFVTEIHAELELTVRELTTQLSVHAIMDYLEIRMSNV